MTCCLVGLQGTATLSVLEASIVSVRSDMSALLAAAMNFCRSSFFRDGF